MRCGSDLGVFRNSPPQKQITSVEIQSYILIVAGDLAGKEGVCLGPAAESGKWAVSPDGFTEILSLTFESEFGLVLDASAGGSRN